jgi:hypothetical protein
MFVTQGKESVSQWLVGSSPLPPSYCAVGSSSTAVALTDTALGSEYAVTRRAFDTVTMPSKTQIEYEMILPSTTLTSGFVREMGLFAGSPTGSMFSHQTFYQLEKTGDIEMQIITGYRVI